MGIHTLLSKDQPSVKTFVLIIPTQLAIKQPVIMDTPSLSKPNQTFVPAIHHMLDSHKEIILLQ